MSPIIEAACVPPQVAGNPVENMEWQLDSLYGGWHDPAWQADQDVLAAETAAFVAEYAGDWDAARFRDALLAYDRLLGLRLKIANYSQLRWRVDTADAQLKARKEAIETLHAEQQQALAFFEIRLASLPEQQLAQWLSPAELRGFKPFVARIRDKAQHRLSPAAEAALAKGSQASRQRWQELHGQLTSSWRYSLEAGSDLSESGALALLSHPDSEVRDKAYTAVLSRYGGHQGLLSYAHDALRQDYASEARLRGYASTLAMQCFDQQIHPDSLLGLLDLMNAQRGLYQRYLSCIRRLRQKPRLMLWDQALDEAGAAWRIPFAAGRELIGSALTRLDPSLGRLVDGLFEGQIHALDTPGKLGLAYCEPMFRQLPFIQLIWRDNLHSLRQLAHETGHGLHFAYSHRENHALGLEPAPWLAEIAATFNEFLVMKHLYARAETPRQGISSLLGLIGIFINGIFRQGTITRFETLIHAAHIKAGQQLDYGRIWLGLNSALAEPAMEIPALEAHGWARIPHLFFQPFYCANYLLSAAAVLHLSGQYERAPSEFLPRYRAFLQAGGRLGSDELLGLLKLDPGSTTFGAGAFAQLEAWIGMLEELVFESEADF